MQDTKIKYYSDLSYDGVESVFVETLGYDIEKTFDCGQCFRFELVENSPYICEYEGIAHGKYIRFAHVGEDKIAIIGTSIAEFEDIWLHYLGLDVDYDKVRRAVLADFSGSEVMERASEYAGGIHILAQERFEVLCSFILSQNNNIPRIKKLIEALCARVGEIVQTRDGQGYAFPSPERLASLSVEDLSALKMGFRARYIADAASKVATGEIDLEKISKQDADKVLMSIVGVGTKVSACTRLFGFCDLSAFPIDVWIKRAIDKYFDGKIDINDIGDYGGIAQQYLFYYERYIGGVTEE